MTRPDVTTREIAPGIHWIWSCRNVDIDGEPCHSQNSAYVVVGPERTSMVDTGSASDWPLVSAALDRILGERSLDLVVPTHPEIPHTGNLGRLFDRYPACVAIGEVRDYHLFYPGHADRLRPLPLGSSIPLGGGYEITLIEAVLRDLENSQWAYERSQQVMFVADGFAYVHHDGGSYSDEPIHRPGECGLLSTELSAPPQAYQAANITRTALAWTRYRDATDLLDRLETLAAAYPTRLVAPTHGNAIADVGGFVPLMREAYRGVLVR